MPDKIDSCPFCRSECRCDHVWEDTHAAVVTCCAAGCSYTSAADDNEAAVISAHNSVSKAAYGKVNLESVIVALSRDVVQLTKEKDVLAKANASIPVDIQSNYAGFYAQVSSLVRERDVAYEDRDKANRELSDLLKWLGDHHE